MKKILLLILLLNKICIAFAQDADDEDAKLNTVDFKQRKEVLLNVTPLLTQFVPFNLGEPDVSRNGIRCKWYGAKYAFRTNLNLSFTADQVKDIYVAIGYERRKPVYKKFTYTSGWDFFVWGSPSEDRPTDNITTLVGPAKFYGIEYNISNRIFVATEAQVMIGFGNGFQFSTHLPTNIMLGVRL